MQDVPVRSAGLQKSPGSAQRPRAPQVTLVSPKRSAKHTPPLMCRLSYHSSEIQRHLKERQQRAGIKGFVTICSQTLKRPIYNIHMHLYAVTHSLMQRVFSVQFPQLCRGPEVYR